MRERCLASICGIHVKNIDKLKGVVQKTGFDVIY